MDSLARREHGRAELAAKLVGRGFEADVVDDALRQLAAEGLLSDRRFVESFVHARVQRGSGPQKIRAELRARGIDDALITACMAPYEDEWLAVLRDVREKKYGAQLPGDFRERSRQQRFLQQRGFSPEQIAHALRDFD